MDEYESDDELGDSYAMRSKQKPGSGRPSGPKSAGYGGEGGGGGKAPTRKGGKEAPTRLEVRDFMDLMDRELAHTAVGQSFTREGDEYEEVSQSMTMTTMISCANEDDYQPCYCCYYACCI